MLQDSPFRPTGPMLEGRQHWVSGFFPEEKPGSSAERVSQPTHRQRRGRRCQDAPVSGLNWVPTAEKLAEK